MKRRFAVTGSPLTRAVFALALLASLAGCKSASSSSATAREASESSTHAPTPAASVAGAASPATTAPTPTAVNRDPHADPDTKRYIARLESPERREDLQVARVVETLFLPSDAVIGDLGCGPGLFALAFAHACPTGLVYASDIEPQQLDRVRERIAAEHVRNLVPVLASPGDPHFPPSRLDLVFVADTYHHLQDRVAYFQRLRETLKPGGRLVILEYKPGTLPVGPPAEHKLPAGVMERELGEAGYTKVASYDTHPYHDFEVWRAKQAWERE